jgi:hypothetical protein
MTAIWDVAPCSLVNIIDASEALAASIIKALIALMMKGARTSETSANFYQTTRRNIPEDSHLLTGKSSRNASPVSHVWVAVLHEIHTSLN